MSGPINLASLNSKRSFEKLSKSGRRTRAQDLNLLYRIVEEQDSINVAYAVGKKVGNAVTRNKVKRRLRSLVREYATNLPTGDYLLIVKPGIEKRRFDELRKELGDILPLKGRQ